MTMVRLMYGVSVKDRVTSVDLRERLGLDNLGTTGKQVVLVWACVANGRQ